MVCNRIGFRRKLSRYLTLLIPFLICASCAMLAAAPELRLAVPLLAGTTASVAILLAFSLYLGEQGRVAWPPSVIIVVALLLRLMFLFSPPQLSDDIYRYLWDGGNLLRGVNPYVAAPATVIPPPGLKAIHAQINHPQYATIYPPAAQVVFAAGAAPGGSLTGLKSFLVLIDLLLCAGLVVLLKQLEMPVWRAVLYAWNPLPIVEIAGSGHVDGAGLAMMMGAFYLAYAVRNDDSEGCGKSLPFFSGALMAAAGLVKLFPFLLLPIVFMLIPRKCRIAFSTGFIAVVALLVLPFMPQLSNGLATLETYGRNWEFAGFAFNLLRRFTDSGNLARFLLSGSFVMIALAIYYRLGMRLPVEQDLTGKWRRGIEACYAVAMALLLLTPTLQPWYALCLTVFLPFCAGPAGLLFCWVVFLTYQVQTPYFILGKWVEDPYVTTAVFCAPVTAGVISWVIGKRMKGMTINRGNDDGIRAGKA